MPLSDEQKLNMKKRRENILEVATELFATEGYEGTTIKKVSEAANISYGSVFTYFNDKEELFRTVVLDPLNELTEVLFDFNPVADDPICELEKMIKTHIHIFAGMSTYLTLIVQVIGQHTKFSETFSELDQFHNKLLDKVSRLVENGQEKRLLIQQEPFTVASLYTSLLIGIRLNTTDARLSDIWDSYISSIMNLFGPIKK
ncbi:TetR/AcrR family transcriptional regulator [Filobacillus milosensis]|uniref:TetR/AcrR family transcriptional regulator n=1 Tax=Filobacillus milosensis TaxID=94137 RepID=A0A4Y8IH74_9BACI|nr:TetR/AcrR family transcriptional regulator [Filobacillus milosensis]TFB15026.1 TetR/AcrR family transcriptional regulator [Filobacillus milosensis]